MANITFLSFLLFSMCHSIHVAVNTWLNCSFFTLITVTMRAIRLDRLFVGMSQFSATVIQGRLLTRQFNPYYRETLRQRQRYLYSSDVVTIQNDLLAPDPLDWIQFLVT